MPKALINADGKLLVKDGKVATDECNAGCCGPNCVPSIPDGADCPHAICFECNVDQAEADAGGASGDFITFSGSQAAQFPVPADTIVLGVYIDYAASRWTAYAESGPSLGNFDQAAVPISGTLAGAWHAVQLTTWTESGVFKAKLIVDGATSSTFTVPVLSIAQSLFVGSNFAAGPSHRSIRNVKLVSNGGFPDETDFNFPPASFDSLDPGVSIIDGGTVRVDLPSGDGHALKTLSPAYAFNCCDEGLVQKISFTASVSGSPDSSPDGCTAFYSCGSSCSPCTNGCGCSFTGGVPGVGIALSLAGANWTVLFNLACASESGGPISFSLGTDPSGHHDFSFDWPAAGTTWSFSVDIAV